MQYIQGLCHKLELEDERYYTLTPSQNDSESLYEKPFDCFQLPHLDITSTEIDSNPFEEPSKEAPPKPKHKKPSTEEQNDIRKYARYDPVVDALKEMTLNSTRIQQLLKKQKKSKRSYCGVFLWIAFLKHELQNNFCLSVLEQGIQEHIQKKYINRSTNFKFHLREEIKKILEGIQLFLSGQFIPSLVIVYCNGDYETAHPTSKKNMDQCKKFLQRVLPTIQ